MWPMWGTDWNERAEKLEAQGLYRADTEHDACGVGLIAAIDGKPRREVVEMGIRALKAVYHRGAVDADGKTGDGAGIHLQIPQLFFESYLARIGKKLLNDRFAVGMVFLPRKNMKAQEECRTIVESEVLRLGFSIYGWRQVPVNPTVIGDVAADSRPEIEQILIAGNERANEEEFERKLFLIRKRIENAVCAQAINDFYLCSLSGRSLIYKGLFKAEQLTEFYPDLLDVCFVSSYAIFHQRFSTNTAPAWHLAQPFRVLAHNGEINTLKGNMNFMKSHEMTMTCPEFAGMEKDLRPVIPANTSDTGALDAVMEMLVRAGRPLPLAKLILVPPAWLTASDMPQAHKDMFAYTACISEAWDGPAAIAATDGRWVIAGMDRNGLRPMRYSLTEDGLLVMGSESGMVPVDETKVQKRGRLGPGDIIGVDLKEGIFYTDGALKDMLAGVEPFAQWVKNITHFDELPPVETPDAALLRPEALLKAQIASGITSEDIELVLQPMAETGKEAIGSMGDDTPLAILSGKYRNLSHFFRQNFSQVTNPPIDSLRERRVMSLNTRFGNNGNFLAFDESHSRTLLLSSPVLLNAELEKLRQHFADKVITIDALFPVDGGEEALRKAIDNVIAQAESAIQSGRPYIVLTDKKRDEKHAGIPMILAAGALNTHLVRRKLRKSASIIVRTAECLDVHHFAVLIGVGATVVNPWLAEATIFDRHARGLLGKLSITDALNNFKEAAGNGILKIMSKMGISIVSSYRGGCNFEALGLSRALVSEYFLSLPSRISGIGLEGIQNRVLELHHKAYANGNVLPIGGFYRFRAREETHAWQAEAISLLQKACVTGDYSLYKQFSKIIADEPPIALRDLLGFSSDRKEIELAEVEPTAAIRKRFIAPAMSLGALSPEAHETLAVAMNRMGAASNSGEGGEGAERYKPRANGDNANSGIKQIASARFGVTAEYLNSASELQIKVAQGAKPGEGGQLPGFKVTAEIARLRHATPGVMLISPPPHHDIYSIEDLAQLIFDLKQINPAATVSVKLVAQSGIGTIASGVAKAMADKIVIAGHVGGTGASPLSSIKHAGIPWEMGLAEANQVLTLNRLRHRVKLQTDGGLKTGRDIVVAAMLGAEEYALGTAALVAMGCLMVRQCHNNTCPVGITTQDPDLRKRFEGKVEHVINLFSFVAEEIREILAKLGYTTLDEIIGRTDLLTQINYGSEDLVDLDLNPLLSLADPGVHARRFSLSGRNEVPDTLDARIIQEAQQALQTGEKIRLRYDVHNTQRAIGTRLSSIMLKRFAGTEVPPDQVVLDLHGSAGQSLGAFAVQGVKICVMGDANDYVGKGLSGATISLKPSASSTLSAHENTIIGNTVLYGATSGKLFAAGEAGERFAVRNCGAMTVVEGCGSNGCEYMTGGMAVILGQVGDNFAAGMTGGMAFVYDTNNNFAARVNPETVVFQRLASPYWEGKLRTLIEEHATETDSAYAKDILKHWHASLARFWQVCPKEMVERLEQPLQAAA
ncbi:MAG TPA: glutamate synthase large subunit [Rickettsiales bacterium]|nr:glutamate synthase large subunit [Rickettsiales bacterium]